MEEPALADTGPAVLVVVGAEQPVQVPTPVGGETRDGVTTGDHELPQVVRCADLARVPAAHPDDRDRFTGGGRCGRHHGQFAVATGQFLADVLGQCFRGRVVEGRGGRQAQPGGGVEPFAQLHRGQRVQTDVPERLSGVDTVRSWEAQHRGDLRAHQLQRQLVLLGR